MLRLLMFTIVAGVLTQLVATAAAHDAICRYDGCFPFGPSYHAKRLHNFRPRAWDGMPMMDSFHDDPTGFHGVGCIWSWRPVATPSGTMRGIGRDCWRY